MLLRRMISSIRREKFPEDAQRHASARRSQAIRNLGTAFKNHIPIRRKIWTSEVQEGSSSRTRANADFSEWVLPILCKN